MLEFFSRVFNMSAFSRVDLNHVLPSKYFNKSEDKCIEESCINQNIFSSYHNFQISPPCDVIWYNDRKTKHSF